MIDPVALLFSFAHGMPHSISALCRMRLRVNFEPFFVLAVLAALIALAVKSFTPLIKTAEYTRIMSHSHAARMDGLLYFAHHGTWPVDTASSLGVGWQDSYRPKGDSPVREVSIRNGAVDVAFVQDGREEVLTMRHAVPGEAPSTAIWVGGHGRRDNAWTVIGEDNTTVDQHYFNRHVR